MSTSVYPFEERDKVYIMVDQMTKMTDLVQSIGMGKAPSNPDLQAAIANMTGATDLHKQHVALESLLKRVKKAHETRIIEVAPHDFSAFVEAINPDEPCRSKVHRFLAGKLQDMADEPEARIALSMPPGHAKDLCVNTPVLMADGSSKRLGDIELGDFVITHTGAPREVIEVHDQGVRETLIIKTASNREISAHPDHLFLTPGGWVPAKSIMRGDVLAQQREFSIRNTSGRSLEEFAIAGYMVGSGLIRGRVYSRMDLIENRFRTDDGMILEDFTKLAQDLGFYSHIKQGIHYGGEVRTAEFSEKFVQWLKDTGLWHLRRRTMRVPEWVFKGSLIEISAFLGSIFALDGSMYPKRSEHSGTLRIMNIKSRNAGLSKDLRRLLMRLGARATYRAQTGSYNYEPTAFHNISITEAEDILFLQKSLRIRGNTQRFWQESIPVKRFFDNMYGEDRVIDVCDSTPTETRCLTVETDHSFLADGIVVHNSTYCSRLYPGWWMGNHAGKKWLQAGHTQRFAEKEFGRKLNTQVLSKLNYGRVFPDLLTTGGVTKSISMDEITLANDSSYVTKGVGQGIAGYRSHFNNIDDPYPTEKAAQSEHTRNTVWDWWTNDFRTRRLPGAQELIIVTRWHSDDIVGRLEELIKKGEVEPWDIINLPALSFGEDEDILKRQKDEPLWPELFTKKFLLDMKGPMEQSRWNSLYQGRPVLAEGNILKRKWIGYYEHMPSELRFGDPTNPALRFEVGGPSESLTGPNESYSRNPVSRVQVVISVDSAEKETVRADYSAIQAWCLASDYKHYLLDSLNEKLSFPALVDAIEAMAAKWEADVILVEEKGAGNQYIQQQEGKSYAPIIGINPGRMDKTMRFDGTMVLWKTKQVLLPAKADFLSDYVEQLLRFPAAKHDDMVDATSQYLNWAREDGGWNRGTVKLGG